MHPILKDQLSHGLFMTLYPKLRMFEPKFFNYFRMLIKSFDELIELIREEISKHDTHMRNKNTRGFRQLTEPSVEPRGCKPSGFRRV